MIGNDIIDLKEARRSSNWQRRGFLKKVFNLTEQQMIQTAKDPFQTVWRLWSMKESAYKFYLQKHPDTVRGFYPTKINCQFLSAELGSVIIRGIQLNTKTTTTTNYIFSTTFLDSSNSTENKVFFLQEKNYKYQSDFTKNKLLNFLSEKKQFDKSQLTIRKSKTGAPLFFYKTQPLSISCSLTHHGNYGGFSVLLSP